MQKCISYILCFYCIPLAVFGQIAGFTGTPKDYMKFSLENLKIASIEPTPTLPVIVEQFTVKTKKRKIVPSASLRLLNQDSVTMRASCKAEISSKKWDREVEFNVSWSY